MPFSLHLTIQVRRRGRHGAVGLGAAVSSVGFFLLTWQDAVHAAHHGGDGSDGYDGEGGEGGGVVEGGGSGEEGRRVSIPAPALAVTICGVVLLAVGNAISTPAITAVLSRYGTQSTQGLILGTSQSLQCAAARPPARPRPLTPTPTNPPLDQRTGLAHPLPARHVRLTHSCTVPWGQTTAGRWRARSGR